MTSHANARTTLHQRKRVRQSRAPDRVQAQPLGVSGAPVATWKRRDNPRARPARPRRVHKARPPDAAPLRRGMRQDWLGDLDTVWLALRRAVCPPLSRSAVSRALVRLQLHQLHALRPQAQRRRGKFRAWPPSFLHVDLVYLPRLDGPRRYLRIAIARATRRLTMQVSPTQKPASARACLSHCQRFSPFRLSRVLTDTGRAFTLRGDRGRGGARTRKVSPFPPACRRVRIRHTLTQAYPPWTNGLAARPGSTIKPETSSRLHFDPVSQLLSAPDGFERSFNYHRPDKALGDKTPDQLTQDWYAKSPQRFLREPPVLFTPW